MELFDLIFTNATFLLLVGGLVIFGILAAKQKRIKSFQFQMAIILLVLIVSEVIDLLFDFNYVENNVLEHLGSILHVSAMAGIALVLWGRYIYSIKAQKSLVDEIKE